MTRTTPRAKAKAMRRRPKVTSKPRQEPEAEAVCPFQSTLDLLGRKHTLSLLWVLRGKAPVRFNEIKRSLGVNPVTLTDRLTELEAAGIVRRDAYAEIPPRVEYVLTDKGQALLPLMDQLDAWAAEWGGGAEG